MSSTQLAGFPIFWFFLGMEIEKGLAWIWYNLFWHFLAPGPAIIYFAKYSQVNLLTKKNKKKGLFLVNLINPTIYFVYVLIRPEITNWRKSEPRQYPFDYPYIFFYWCRGKRYSRDEKEKFLCLNWNNSWYSALIWSLVVVVFWWLVFSFLFRLLIKTKLKLIVKREEATYPMKKAL